MRVLENKDFGTRECPSCACEVPANSNRCPICGYLFPAPSVRQRRMRFWGAWLMLSLMMLVFVFSRCG